MDPLSEELQPFVLCEPSADGKCATWRLESHAMDALALFASEDAAMAYRDLPNAGVQGWAVIQPTRQQLAQLVAATLAAGVSLAVLDPDEGGAKRVFDLEAMRQQVDADQAP